MANNPATSFTLKPYDYGEVRELMSELELAEPVAVTLVRRGYRSVEQARTFLAAEDDHDPFAFEAMADVVARIRAAVAARRRITVHGDYDVDGVCSTSILVRALRRLGADCDWLIPDRMEDGYGLTLATVEKLVERGTGLLITVDCGIGSVAEVAAARAAGLEVIVTDHHQPSTELPDCPILHPVVSGYPFAELCATAVAYKLAAALHGREAVTEELDLVALATVADLVPLRGENRALVRRGLAEARQARRPGLRALITSSAVTAERLDEGSLAFRLGPRINAAGRLYRADAGVELMLTDDPAVADRIAAELERANHERREVEREVLRGAEQALAALPDDQHDAAGLVLAGEGWHPGVVGIVASRLTERLFKPIVLVALDEDGGGRGSGRSVPGFDLLAALDACAEHLGRYGGHRAAAGVELAPGKLESFRAAFAAAAARAIPAGGLTKLENVDAVVGGESLGHEVAEQLQALGPFGLGNPGVRLLVPGARVSDVKPMGDADQHARFSLASGSRRALGVAFSINGGLDAVAAQGPLDVSVKLELNEWNGAVEPRVVLGELYALPDPDPAPDAVEARTEERIGDEEFWRRYDAETELALTPWPRATPPARSARELVDRRGGSAIATIAALASSGGTLLVVCADAVRRRALVERAARPARFGGGEVAVFSGRLAERGFATASLVRDSGSGTVLADWTALTREPRFIEGFEHVVVVDPGAFAFQDELARRGEGYLHRVDGPAEWEFALRCHGDEWPSRSSLAELYRGLRAAGGEAEPIAAVRARELICGEGRSNPRSPECAARVARVLAELGLLEWEGSGIVRALRVVSSEASDLEHSTAFLAYRERYEQGRRWLTEQKQTTS